MKSGVHVSAPLSNPRRDRRGNQRFQRRDHDGNRGRFSLREQSIWLIRRQCGLRPVAGPAMYPIQPGVCLRRYYIPPPPLIWDWLLYPQHCVYRLVVVFSCLVEGEFVISWGRVEAKCSLLE
jgi:hypothetical protein